MTKISEYPVIATPELDDLLIGTDANNSDITKNFSIGSVVNLVENGGRPYNSYAALLTQSETDAPTAIVLENTIGGTVSWTRFDEGIYIGTLSTAIDIEKSGIFTANNVSNALYTSFINSPTEIEIRTANLNSGIPALVDAYLNFTLVELRVYN